MTTTQSTLSELLWPGLKVNFGLSYNEWVEEYSKIFDMETSDKASEEYNETTSFGLVPRKAEGAETTYDDPIQGYKTTLTNLMYSLGFKVTEEMHEDGQYGIIKKMPTYLANSVKETVETMGANILNRAFNASYTGGDGKVLCATDHPLPGGGSYKNRPTVNADLSATSLEQALIDIGGLVDGRNKKIAVKPVRLIVSTTDDYKASELLDSTKDPESANNAINPAQGRMPYTINHYLTDTDAWFIRTDQEGLICQKRKFPAVFVKDNEFDTDIAKFKTKFRLAFGWYDSRSIYGSAGV